MTTTITAHHVAAADQYEARLRDRRCCRSLERCDTCAPDTMAYSAHQMVVRALRHQGA